MEEKPEIDRIVDLALSADRQLHSAVVAYVECIDADTEACLLRSRSQRTPWPYQIAIYRRTKLAFTRRQSFKTMTEAWVNFTSLVELCCLTKDTDSGIVPTRIKPKPTEDSHGRGETGKQKPPKD